MKRGKLNLIIVLTVILVLLLTQIPVNASTVTGPGGVARLDYMNSAPGWFT